VEGAFTEEKRSGKKWDQGRIAEGSITENQTQNVRGEKIIATSYKKKKITDYGQKEEGTSLGKGRGERSKAAGGGKG